MRVTSADFLQTPISTRTSQATGTDSIVVPQSLTRDTATSRRSTRTPTSATEMLPSIRRTGPGPVRQSPTTHTHLEETPQRWLRARPTNLVSTRREGTQGP